MESQQDTPVELQQTPVESQQNIPSKSISNNIDQWDMKNSFNDLLNNTFQLFILY